MSLRVERVVVTPFQQNCSVIWCSESLEGAVIDPGGDIEKIIDVIQQHKIDVKQILLTHGHLDHAGGAAALSKQLAVPVNGPHQADEFWLQGITEQGKQYGFSGAENCQPDNWLNEGDFISIGKESLSTIHCPGHTPGHLVFHHANSALAFVGDVIFKGSIGRTDFPQGNHQDLINSITQKLWPLGNKTRFLSGHGPLSTFGEERQNNAFVADSRLG